MSKTKRCEYCGKDINQTYMTCPFCGGHLHEECKTITPLCPRCGIPLMVQVHDREEYSFCPTCNGLWLDSDEFHHATTEAEAYQKETGGDRYFHKPINDRVKYIPCVRCGKMMNRRNFRRISGVIIDECSNHGVWLDAGELEKIQHFIADGGLDRAQDREIEENRTELRDLATKVDQTAFMEKLIHFWNFKRWLFGG